MFPVSSKMKTWNMIDSTDVIHAVIISSIYNRSKNIDLFFIYVYSCQEILLKTDLVWHLRFNTSTTYWHRSISLCTLQTETKYAACFPARFFFRVYAAKQALSSSKFQASM